MKRKRYWEMATNELAEATKQFDEPFVADQARPLNASEREEWAEATRKRPKRSRGLKRFSVSMEPELLERVTALAKKHRISRSVLVARALEDALAQER
jgi:predicted transcriptional regulator